MARRFLDNEGRTPLEFPQEGVPASTDNQLATLGQIRNLIAVATNFSWRQLNITPSSLASVSFSAPFIVGSERLLVFVDGILQVRGIGYLEDGAVDDSSSSITLIGENANDPQLKRASAIFFGVSTLPTGSIGSPVGTLREVTGSSVVLSTSDVSSTIRVSGTHTSVVSVVLPIASDAGDGAFIIIRDISISTGGVVGASANNINISPAGLDTVDSNSILILDNDNSSVTLVANAAQRNWEIQSKYR